MQKYLYGLSENSYNRMLLAQGGKCFICMKPAEENTRTQASFGKKSLGKAPRVFPMCGFANTMPKTLPSTRLHPFAEWAVVGYRTGAQENAGR